MKERLLRGHGRKKVVCGREKYGGREDEGQEVMEALARSRTQRIMHVRSRRGWLAMQGWVNGAEDAAVVFVFV